MRQIGKDRCAYVPRNSACDDSRLRSMEDFEVCRAALKIKWGISIDFQLGMCRKF